MLFDLKVGTSCNNSCIHCVVGDEIMANNNNLSFKEIKDILVNNINNIDTLQLTGGETTIRPDFLDILKYAKNELGIKKIILQTNGRMFSSLD